MPFSRAGQLARAVPTARLTDPLGLVAENLRNSPYGVVPVLDRPTFGEGDPSEIGARVVGLVDVRDLSRVSEMILAPVYANGDSNGAPSPNFENLKARDVMRADVPHVPTLFSLHNALMTLDRYDLPALPVLDERGGYHGLISRADILAALGNNVRPPLVGGMATPLGVWLTDGVQTGGVPNFALFLSGLTLAFCFVIASVLLTLILHAIEPSWGAAALSGRIGAEVGFSGLIHGIEPNGGGLFNTLAFIAHGLLFVGILRLLPMAGIHAAEHQTVWALERGLPLEVEYVEKMPRAHPRCGSNLMALLGLVLIGFNHIPYFSMGWTLVVLIITFFGWRTFGNLLQEWFTTRPASRKQLESGIKAARELMDKYQAQPVAAPSHPLRLLNNGMIYSAVGMYLGIYGFSWLMDWMAVWLFKLQ